MSMFIMIPNQGEDRDLIINLKAVKHVLRDKKYVYITFNVRMGEQVTVKFETEKEAKYFVEKTFTLFNP